MKKIIIIGLLALSVLAFGEGITMSVSVDGNSNSKSSSINVVDEIAKRVDILQKKYNSKLNKLDQKRTGKIIDEIYELLALLPEESAVASVNEEANVNISVKVNDKQTEFQTTNIEMEDIEKTDVPQAMSDSEFQNLLDNVQNEGFADDQTSVVRIAAKSKNFSISQLIFLLDVFSFSDDKINIVQIVYPKVVDKDNSHNLLGAFTYSDDKDRVEEIISN
ncbi:MAG: DUF4476 domain-containing protein [Candidatus Tenebribacter davisii]|jgi:hypothetical protein|nr:DUF4476 domain-containing protein [Candidatus Tenebribacter davisii]